MTNNRKTGNTGLSILEIKPSTTPKRKQTAKEVATWVTTLPMADIGAAAKKLFVQLTETSETTMTAQERYSIMELLRSPNNIICTALKRHYIEQIEPLTEHKIIIANLRQTLLTAMADNYKLIFEELHNKQELTENEKFLMATSIVRIYYYLNVLLICRYQLYTYTPENLWHEIHLLYKYSKKRDLLDLEVPCQFANGNITTVNQAYMHIILLYATDPYQWRQREQHSLNKAIDMWALYPTVYEAKQIPDKKTGIYIIDLEKDEPPIAAHFKHDAITASCIAVDLANSVHHLHEILTKMQSDHLKAKIENPKDPEFSVTAPTVAKLISIWSQQTNRAAPRTPISAQIKIVFGLTAAHYYINGEKEFNPHPSNLSTNFNNAETNTTNKGFSNSLNLQSYEVIEEIENEEDIEESLSNDKNAASKQASEEKGSEEDMSEEGVSKELLYHIYDYNIDNINPQGFGVVITDKSYPPFQAGEIVAFKNIASKSTGWSIGSVRWLRRHANENFHIGIQIIAALTKAAGIQMLRADKPASRLSRCLILPEDKEALSPPMLITTAVPINSNTVMLYTDQETPIKATLTQEIDASGMYYQYMYSTENGVEVGSLEAAQGATTTTNNKTAGNDEDQTNTEFDKIWGDL